jgi:hypothetical protein
LSWIPKIRRAMGRPRFTHPERMRYHRTPSTPHLPIDPMGSTTFPLDLDILDRAIVQCAWARTVRGGSSPADMSSAGQWMAWNLQRKAKSAVRCQVPSEKAESNRINQIESIKSNQSNRIESDRIKSNQKLV